LSRNDASIQKSPERYAHDRPHKRGRTERRSTLEANKELWPPGVREIAMQEQDCLGIDRHGNLYWDGKPVEVRHFWLSLLLTRWQQVGAVIIVVSALFGAIGAAAQGWVAYEDWACRAGWPAVGCAQLD
jgi:hypothetical protein